MLAGVVGVRNSYVEKRVLATTPKSLCADVESCVIVEVCCPMVSYSIGDRLKIRFTFNILCDNFKHVALEVPDVVVTSNNKTAAHTVHGVCHIESYTAWALGWEVLSRLFVSKTQCVLEF